MNLNIVQQLNTSRDEIAYNVVDLQDFPEGEVCFAQSCSFWMLARAIPRPLHCGKRPRSIHVPGPLVRLTAFHALLIVLGGCQHAAPAP